MYNKQYALSQVAKVLIQLYDSGLEVSSIDKFQPRLTSEERDVRYERWKDAVERSFNWIKEPPVVVADNEAEIVMTLASSKMYASLSPAIFLWTSFLLWKLADWMDSS